MALSETKICNLSLSDIGSKRINNLETDDSLESILCRLHYEPTRDALIRSHWWRFASTRAVLSQDTTDPVGDEWDNQFILPDDFLAMKSVYENRFSDENYRSYALEGQRLLTNESTMEIRYIKKVTNPTKFDPLFVQVFVLQLDLKLLTGLAKTDTKLKESIKDDLKLLMPSVKALDGQETNTIGEQELGTWNNARYT